MADIKVMESEKIRGRGIQFDRIRRITGYLVGDMGRWNSAKSAEEHDRVKHGSSYMDKLDAVSVEIEETVSA